MYVPHTTLNHLPSLYRFKTKSKSIFNLLLFHILNLLSGIFHDVTFCLFLFLEPEEDDDRALIIGLSVAGVVVILVIALLIAYCAYVFR